MPCSTTADMKTVDNSVWGGTHSRKIILHIGSKLVSTIEIDFQIKKTTAAEVAVSETLIICD